MTQESRPTSPDPENDAPLRLDLPAVTSQLESFLHREITGRGFENAIMGLSGGVDSAVSAALCARALGAEHVIALCLPYKTSSPDSLAHARMLIDQLGVRADTIDISPVVDAYLANVPEADARRRGNVMARARMIVLFDQSEKYKALPVGTGNKTERLFGYFTLHGDDSPPINPLGDLFKTQVRALARHLGIPDEIIDKHPSADLVIGQTDEADLGISYAKADLILHHLLEGCSVEQLAEHGFNMKELQTVKRRLDSTNWKRSLPTIAML
ncbi:MAG: NAD+ synthase [Armatimonadetes bacterium]|nr:NAD+ synthase [Armatimonadota bacterium]NIO75578.1 NAD+ synthase [Armatimonadota bacterium]NIO98106.1 NAD+ synthase [Armatimonadota bacterium]